MVFVAHMAYYLMFNYCSYPTKLECFLLFWVVALLSDELRQIFQMPSREYSIHSNAFISSIGMVFLSTKEKLQIYFHGEIWDTMDFGYQIFFVIGFLIKNSDEIKHVLLNEISHSGGKFWGTEFYKNEETSQIIVHLL
jgi:hypothetical protein